MNLEIERRFLVHSKKLPKLVRGQRIVQGYLSVNPTVRVRIKGRKSYLTIKFGTAMKREEYEWTISKNDSEELLNKCEFRIEKTRYNFRLNGNLWEIDVFEDKNKGMVIAEIELDHSNQRIQKPLWLAQEITLDEKYLNVNLAQQPYESW